MPATLGLRQGTRGYWIPGQRPSFTNTSLWQTPQACTLMRTSPAPGFGISRSTISKSPPGFEICATFIGAIPTFVVAIISPLNFQQILISLCDRSVAYLPSSTLDSRRDLPVTNYLLNAWVPRTDKTNLHAKNQRSVTDTGAALPRFAS